MPLDEYLPGKRYTKKQQPNFPGADKIVNRIEWDPKLNSDEFVIGYIDRFTGMQELSFKEFREDSDHTLHSIRYFLRNGELVWHRKNRINTL